MSKKFKNVLGLLEIRLADIRIHKDQLQATGIAFDFDKSMKMYDSEIAEFELAIIKLKQESCDHNWVSSVAYKGAKHCGKCDTYK